MIHEVGDDGASWLTNPKLKGRTIMLHLAKNIKGYRLDSLNGEIGKAREFYFDDRYWTVRYLVADTGGWLTGRQVLISPYALVGALADEERIEVNLTKQQIEDSPSLDSDKPVSRQFEESYYGYYGWPVYWAGMDAWGYSPYLLRDPEEWVRSPAKEKAWDPHLRSSREVTGYPIEAKDGEIGHVEDFLIDDVEWTIRYLVVDTRNWWPGKKVLIAPDWIERVSWTDHRVTVNLTREAIKNSPEFYEDALPSRTDEAALHRHYDRPGYWDRQPSVPSQIV